MEVIIIFDENLYMVLFKKKKNISITKLREWLFIEKKTTI